METKLTYIKYFFILANVVLTMYVISAGSIIFSPLIAALIMAILLNPLYTKLLILKFPRMVSAIICVTLFFLLIALLLSFLTAQLGYITADPGLSAAPIVKMIESSQQWAASFFNFSLSDQSKFIEESFNNFIKQLLTYAPNAFTGTTQYLSIFLLFFMSLFFFLYYNHFFMSFIFRLFGKNNREYVIETADKIQFAVKNYIVGLFIVITIIASLNSIGLIILGVKHALFFGILGALLTIIPYIGILIGSLIPALFSFVYTQSLWMPISVIILFSLVQFLEGNFITPNIIGNKENINPYIAILGLFVGGMLLGAVGIILAIPLLGILKIICDDIEPLKPFGYVMGNPPSEQTTIWKWFTNLFQRKVK